MPRGFIVVFVIALAILFGFEYFIYFSATRLLGVHGKGARRMIMAALALALIGVIASLFLQRSVDTNFARAIAGAFQLSVAFTLQLAMAFVLAWAAWLAWRAYSPHANSAVLGWAAIILAALVSVYGFWNATNPKVERVTVRMRDLPAEWQGKTIAQISDLHLGFSVGRAFAHKVVAMVNAENPAAVVITGDLFDGADSQLGGLAEALNGLNPPMGVYFITGNHETYVGVARAEEALLGTPVRILRDEMVTPGGLQIIGIAYPDRGESKDVGAAIRKVSGYNPAKASVLLYHSPVQIPGIRSTGVRLQLSGHTHRGQLFPFQFITDAVYGKYDHGLTVEDGFSVYTCPGTGTWGPRMRTSSRSEIALIRLESI